MMTTISLMPASMASTTAYFGETRRHEHDARLGAGDFHGFGAIAEHTQRNILAVFGRWEIDFLAGLAGVDAADDIGAGLQHAGGMVMPDVRSYPAR